MNRCLCALLLLLVFLGGCTDVDMSGFNHIGFTMQHSTSPRPAAPEPTDKPATQLAHYPNHPAAPTP
jgi:hypothetical protein